MSDDKKAPPARIRRMLDKSAGIRSTAEIPQAEAPRLADPQTAVGMRGALAAAQSRVNELEAMLAEGRANTLIDIDLIDRNPDQPRLEFDADELRQLARDIKTAGGLIQPIVLRPSQVTPGRYQLVAGERRLEASKLNGEVKISAVVRDVPDFDMAVMALLENIGRQNLTDYEISRSLRQMEHKFPTKKAMYTEIRLSRSDFYRLAAFDAMPAFLLADLERAPRLLGGSVAYELKSTLDKFGDKAQARLQELWPDVVAKRLPQTKLVAAIESSLVRRASMATTDGRNIHKLFTGKEQAGSITKDDKSFTIKIKTPLLKPEQEAKFRELATKLFKEIPS